MEDQELVKTVVPKMKEIQEKWYVVDAHNQILGRLATQVAHVLRGKHRSDFTPHLDLGDHVVIINAEKIRVSGKKYSQKFYTRYTGYPGGLRIQSYKMLLHDKPERILYHAVKGMLPKTGSVVK